MKLPRSVSVMLAFSASFFLHFLSLLSLTLWLHHSVSVPFSITSQPHSIALFSLILCYLSRLFFLLFSIISVSVLYVCAFMYVCVCVCRFLSSITFLSSWLSLIRFYSFFSLWQDIGLPSHLDLHVHTHALMHTSPSLFLSVLSGSLPACQLWPVACPP